MSRFDKFKWRVVIEGKENEPVAYGHNRSEMVVTANKLRGEGVPAHIVKRKVKDGLVVKERAEEPAHGPQ